MRWSPLGLTSTLALCFVLQAWSQDTHASESPADESFDVGEADDGDDESFDFGDDDEAFDFGDDGDGGASDVVLPVTASDWSFWLTGFVRSDWALWAERFDGNPFAKARQSVDMVTGASWRALKLDVALHAEYDVAYLYERDSYDTATLDTYEWLVNTREVQLAASLGDFELTVGRQIVAWGEGDMLSPLDVVNPRDMREPGQSDLADIRLPVLATRVGWFFGGHRLELMVVHESEFGYRSPPRGPYSGLEAMLSSGLLGDLGGLDLSAMLQGAELSYRHVQPRFSADQQEVYLRWVYNGSGFDLGAYFASFLDPVGTLSLDQEALAPVVMAGLSGGAPSELALGVDHQRYHLAGFSGAHTADSVLLKWEVTLDIGRPVGVLTAGVPFDMPGAVRREVFNVMMGITWTGVQHLTLGAEFLSTILLDEPEGMLAEMTGPTLAIRASYQALDDRLVLSGTAMVMGWDQGWLVRGDLTYELIDALQVGVGFVTYQPGEGFGPFYGLDRHDRLFTGLRWDFQAL